MTLQLRAHIEGVMCCRGCLRVWLLCPTCGRMLTSPPLWVRAVASIVCTCSAGVETTVQVDVVGFKPNPTGDAAAALSPDLSHLRRCWVKPAAAKPAARPAPPPAAPPRLPYPAAPLRTATPYRAPQRKRPSCRPARRAARVYSLRELRHCLGELKAKANRSSES